MIVITKYKQAIIGTIISSTLTVAFFLSTITAAIATKKIVEYNGGIWNAFSKEEETELLITWLIPPQQIKPEIANNTAMTERFGGFDFFLVKNAWI